MTRDATGWATIGHDDSGFRFYHFDLDGTASVGVEADATSIAWTGTAYLVSHQYEQKLRACATWAEVQSGSCPLYGALPAGNERFATDWAELYGAWHSTEEVDVYDLGTLARKRTIPLEDWDTWVRGMSVVGGSLFVIDDGRQYPDQRIVEFDGMTGRIRNRVFLPDVPFSLSTGLWCSDAPL